MPWARLSGQLARAMAAARLPGSFEAPGAGVGAARFDGLAPRARVGPANGPGQAGRDQPLS